MRDFGERDRGEVEDYTNAFLGMAYLILFMVLVVVWGIWGYPLALAICAALHHGIRRLDLRRAEAAADWQARVTAALERGRCQEAAPCVRERGRR